MLNSFKNCLNCGNEFRLRQKTNKFCGNDCYLTYIRISRTKICSYVECSKEYLSNSSSQKYCSISCSAKYNNSASPKRKKEGKCAECGDAINASKKFCNMHTKSVKECNDLPDTKKCGACGKHLPLEDFHKNSTTRLGRQSSCKKCNISNVVSWQKEDKERHVKSWKKSQEPTKERSLKRRLTKYGISDEKYQELVDEAGGLCMICGNTPSNGILNIDHCHTSNNVRGLLCHNCNSGLGLFKDNIGSLESAIKYLQKFQISSEDV